MKEQIAVLEGPNSENLSAGGCKSRRGGQTSEEMRDD